LVIQVTSSSVLAKMSSKNLKMIRALSRRLKNPYASPVKGIKTRNQPEEELVIQANELVCSYLKSKFLKTCHVLFICQ
jgi:hypothetical protein